MLPLGRIRVEVQTCIYHKVQPGNTKVGIRSLHIFLYIGGHVAGQPNWFRLVHRRGYSFKMAYPISLLFFFPFSLIHFMCNVLLKIILSSTIVLYTCTKLFFFLSLPFNEAF